MLYKEYVCYDCGFMTFTGIGHCCCTRCENTQPRFERLHAGLSTFTECRYWTTTGASEYYFVADTVLLEIVILMMKVNHALQ